MCKKLCRPKVLKIFIDDFLKLIQIRLTMCHSRANKLGCTKSRDTVPLSLSRRLSILTLLLYILHRVWNSLFCSFALRSFAQNGSFQEQLWAIRSHRSLQKSDFGRFAHFALYKRATVRDSLLLFFTKEQCEQIAFIAHWKRAMWVIHSWSEWIACKKQTIRSKNLYFSFVFWQFFRLFSLLIYAQEQIAPMALS